MGNVIPFPPRKSPDDEPSKPIIEPVPLEDDSPGIEDKILTEKDLLDSIKASIKRHPSSSGVRPETETSSDE